MNIDNSTFYFQVNNRLRSVLEDATLDLNLCDNYNDFKITTTDKHTIPKPWFKDEACLIEKFIVCYRMEGYDYCIVPNCNVMIRHKLKLRTGDFFKQVSRIEGRQHSYTSKTHAKQFIVANSRLCSALGLNTITQVQRKSENVWVRINIGKNIGSLVIGYHILRFTGLKEIRAIDDFCTYSEDHTLQSLDDYFVRCYGNFKLRLDFCFLKFHGKVSGYPSRCVESFDSVIKRNLDVYVSNSSKYDVLAHDLFPSLGYDFRKILESDIPHGTFDNGVVDFLFPGSCFGVLSVVDIANSLKVNSAFINPNSKYAVLVNHINLVRVLFHPYSTQQMMSNLAACIPGLVNRYAIPDNYNIGYNKTFYGRTSYNSFLISLCDGLAAVNLSRSLVAFISVVLRSRESDPLILKKCEDRMIYKWCVGRYAQSILRGSDFFGILSRRDKYFLKCDGCGEKLKETNYKPKKPFVCNTCTSKSKLECSNCGNKFSSKFYVLPKYRVCKSCGCKGDKLEYANVVYYSVGIIPMKHKEQHIMEEFSFLIDALPNEELLARKDKDYDVKRDWWLWDDVATLDILDEVFYNHYRRFNAKNAAEREEVISKMRRYKRIKKVLLDFYDDLFVTLVVNGKNSALMPAHVYDLKKDDDVFYRCDDYVLTRADMKAVRGVDHTERMKHIFRFNTKIKNFPRDRVTDRFIEDVGVFDSL
jgi:hypothetical protein